MLKIKRSNKLMKYIYTMPWKILSRAENQL